ncbi:MAG: GGDEF domain-containing protein, partial [Woeseiaceae bacterium]|nr:GGDEF domain-containing protein [Woeseiaceae bacterium]
LARRWTNEKFRHEPVSIILIDIDFFKLFNDSYGHQAGDECLQRVAHALTECATRPQDLVARFGGEEFVAILGNTSTDNALIVAARMRKVIESLSIPHPDSDHGVVTVSCGIATVIPAAGQDAASTLKSADEALYAAKAAGRNQVNYRRGGRHVEFEDSSAILETTNVMKILKMKKT